MNKKKLLGFVFLFTCLLVGGSFLFFGSFGADKPVVVGDLLPTASPKRPVLRLAVFADIHSDWEKLQKAVKKVNNDNDVDVVLVLGDLTNLGSLDDLNKSKEILDGLSASYYVMPGNHDVWYSRRAGQAADYNFEQVFGRQAACFSAKGFNLVLLDNSDEQRTIEQNHWRDIQTCLEKSEPILFFMHEPLYHPASERLMGQYLPELADQADILTGKLCDKRAKLAAAAHLHSFSRYNYVCDNDYKLPMIVSPALTRERNFQTPRFLYLDVFEDGGFEEREIEI